MIEFFQNIDTASFAVGMFTVMILDMLFAFLNCLTNRAFDKKRRELERKDFEDRLDLLEKQQEAIEQHFLGKEYPWND